MSIHPKVRMHFEKGNKHVIGFGLSYTYEFARGSDLLANLSLFI